MRACCPSASVRDDMHYRTSRIKIYRVERGPEMLGDHPNGPIFFEGLRLHTRHSSDPLAASISQTRAHPQHPLHPLHPPCGMSPAVPLSPAAQAKAAEALPAPVSSSSPSTIYSTLRRGALREFFMTEVDPDRSTIPLAAYCFMTGWMSVYQSPSRRHR